MRILSKSPDMARQSGFSLIDVMIAVVVLATGMLALAALQGSLVRSSAETRSRNQAVAIAEAVLGATRGQADANITWYDEISSGNGRDAPGAGTADTNLLTKLADAGITNPIAGTYGESFTVTSEVQRYVPDSTVAACGAGNVPCYRKATVADTTRAIGEYKLVTSDVRWTDAAGVEHQISLSDVLSSLPSSNSKELVNRDLAGTKRRLSGPKLRVPVPKDAGIIPVAIGDGRETAATNPKPVLDTSFGTQDTKFDVLTYAVDGNVAEVQRRVETQVISCRCKRGAPAGVPTGATFFTTKVRPTFWTGTRYSVPDTAAQVPVAIDDAWGADIDVDDEDRDGKTTDDISQSPLCDDCCRDHHDPGGLPVEKPKFSPYRSAHDHYRRKLDGTYELVADSSHNYFEGCRMIRVGGIWRASADVRLEHMNLLETADFARSFVPSSTGTPSAVKRYESFVKSFLSARVLPTATGGTPDVAALESTNSLNTPSQILIEPRLTDTRFMHDRALYLDFLEPNTRSFLEGKVVACPTGTPKIDCLLPFLPFVSINTTEIAKWGTAAVTPTKLTVTNQDGSFGVNEPRRGKARPANVNDIAEGDTATVLVRMDRTNSGLNDSPPVNPLDITPVTGQPARFLDDSQQFRFTKSALTDTDSDGVPDGIDNCDQPNPTQSDIDGDKIGDACETDPDNDGIDSEKDNCPLVANADQLDDDWSTGADPDKDGINGDGIGTACDPSADNDGDTVLDGDDNCPFASNPAQNPGACEVDTDGDTVKDIDDNCPTVANTDQADKDGDKKGDVCDDDAKITFRINATFADGGLEQSAPDIAWLFGTIPAECTDGNPLDTTPNPYICDGAFGPDVTVVFKGYNRIEIAPERVSNPCDNGNKKDTDVPVCYNYRVNTSGMTLVGSPVVSPSGGNSEVTTLTLKGLTNGQTVTAPFVLEGTKNLYTLGLGVGYTCGSFSNPTAVVFKTEQCN